MRDKKQDEDEKTAERKALERHVDAMMDPKLPDTPAADEDPAVNSAPAAKTAPQLSAQLRKKIGISDADTKPLSIDKLDELTEKISASDEAEPAPDGADDQDSGLDDARTDEAVDDIVSHEGDVMLAVADATAAEHNRELQEKNPDKDKGGHHIFSTFLWTLVFFVAIVAILLLVLLVTGGNVTGLN